MYRGVGFLIPNRPDLKASQRLDFAVGVREIEQAAGINFMPTLGGDDAVETRASDALLAILRNE